MTSRIRAPLWWVPAAAGLILGAAWFAAAQEVTQEEIGAYPHLASQFPQTDFEQRSVPLSDFMIGQVKDGIPSIDEPEFVSVGAVAAAGPLGPQEPVIAVELNGELKGYPLQILMWHEIVNDVVGGIPVAVTYCPLCNSSVVFKREVDGQVLDFGTTGMLRNSDLVMYDRQTESWWQQFLGEAIVGEMTGTMLEMVPVRIESFERFQARGGHGQMLIPNSRFTRSYGMNPYANYDSRTKPYDFFQGDLPPGLPPLERVVAVGEEAWALSLLREKGEVRKDDLILTWEAGQNSALDSGWIARGRDVGNVIVQREAADGSRADVVHDITFAFAFHAFRPEAPIYTSESATQ